MALELRLFCRLLFLKDKNKPGNLISKYFLGLVLEFVLIVSVAQWDVNHSGVSDEGLIVECCSVSPSVMFVTAHH